MAAAEKALLLVAGRVRHVSDTGSVEVGAQVQSTAGNLTLVATGSNNILLNPTAGFVGIGTVSPTSYLQIAGSFSTPVVAKTSAYTLTASDYTVLVTASTAVINVTLPSAVGILGRIYKIKRMDSSAFETMVLTTGGQTIDGQAYVALGVAFQVLEVQSDGANWVEV